MNLHDSKENFVPFRAFSWLSLLAFAATAAANDAAPSFSRDVRPILSNHCFKCHGPDDAQRKADLRLDTEADLRNVATPNDDGAILLLDRITHADVGERMPPADANLDLSSEQIDTLRQWINAGAPYEVHWAFEPPKRPQPPEVENAEWVQTPIDRFILARLEAAGLTPSPQADPATLLRRVSLDLTGLPPTPEHLRRFLDNPSDEAYAREVDRLLASPHYGERWARHWLDAARYADSNGYSIDGPRSIWPYRDWVIDAFNADMPFDQFTIAQLAGDLVANQLASDNSSLDSTSHSERSEESLRSDTPTSEILFATAQNDEPADTLSHDLATELRVATGFHRNTMINQEGGVDPEEFRLEAVVDRVNTTATVWLGLTMNCAECHTHKYDPITQTEFYQFFAFFNSDNEKSIELPTPEEEAERERIRDEIRERSRELHDYLKSTRDAEQIEWEAALTPEEIAKLDAEAQAALEILRDERTTKQARAIENAFKEYDPEYQRRAKAIEKLRNSEPDIATSMILDPRDEPRETRIHLGGDFTRKGDPVEPGVPSILHPLEGEAKNRLDLAEWLVDPANPLTARVTVNRFWQRFFGKGIVGTENDFGIQGRPPTHPELLDWLAVEFIESGWRIKAMHRMIVLSAVYRQASLAREDLAAKDPTNRLLGRQNRLRLEAEIIRDTALATAGVLNPEIGGPPVFPPQPDGVMNLGQRNRPWNADEGPDRFRRGMYTFFWRATPHPALMVFDAPDAMTACTRRNRSNTPLQALTLLNDFAFFELAQAFAGRILDEALPIDKKRIEHAIRLAYRREPEAHEIETLSNLLERQRESFEHDLERAETIANCEWLKPYPPREAAAYTMLARALMNTDEFITRE